MFNSKLMVSSDGNLFDTSKQNWHLLPPLRVNYCATRQSIGSIADLKATLRNGAVTDFGGYPLYFITSDGGALSFDSVRKNFRAVIESIKNHINDGWRVVACDVNYEDDDLYCDHSSEKIDSAYGGN